MELTELLDVAGVTPPFALVGQSFGRILAREFLLMHGKEKVRGMVIVNNTLEEQSCLAIGGHC
jgi:pimeloyl-ACP methyl ester carboxylesterase